MVGSTMQRPFPHAIAAGIERYPRKVTKSMGQGEVMPSDAI
jgi:large subunit ribosomal protein L27e